MNDFFIISLVYPDDGPVWFMFWMFVVIAIAIIWGMRE